MVQTSMEYSVMYGRRNPTLFFYERQPEEGFNVCLTVLQGIIRVYGIYREQRGSVSTAQNHVMSELHSAYHKVIQAGYTLLWIAKPLCTCINNFLYIMYEYFLDIGMLETACDVQLVYLTEFL